MANQKLEDIISYAETKLNTLTDLDIVRYTDSDSQPIPVKTYGAHIYIGDETPWEDERRHIGPLLTQTYTVNIDIIINKRFKDRLSVSDAKGISYWKNTVTELLLNGTNGGLFKDSFWKPIELDDSEDGYIIKGILTVEVLNRY